MCCLLVYYFFNVCVSVCQCVRMRVGVHEHVCKRPEVLDPGAGGMGRQLVMGCPLWVLGRELLPS